MAWHQGMWTLHRVKCDALLRTRDGPGGFGLCHNIALVELPSEYGMVLSLRTGEVCAE